MVSVGAYFCPFHLGHYKKKNTCVCNIRFGLSTARCEGKVVQNACTFSEKHNTCYTHSNITSIHIHDRIHVQRTILCMNVYVHRHTNAHTSLMIFTTHMRRYKHAHIDLYEHSYVNMYRQIHKNIHTHKHKYL